MKRLLLCIGMLVLTLAPGAEAVQTAGLTVTLEPVQVVVPVGESFTVSAQVHNDGASRTAPLLAHLDIVSLSSSVYVDPEDWSSSRTHGLPSLAAGQGTTVTWLVRAVNAGRFDVHVVVLPVLGQGAGPLAVSTPTYATVTARRTLNPGGSLGVVLGVPAIVAAGAVVSLLVRRRGGR